MGPIETLRAEAHVIAGAPWSFLISVVAVGAIIWWAMDWRYGSIVAKLKERLEAKGGGELGEAITQAGAVVARALVPRIDQAAKSVHLSQVFAGPLFDVNKEFEFRGLRLKFVTHAMATGNENERGETDMIYSGMVCQIVT